MQSNTMIENILYTILTSFISAVSVIAILIALFEKIIHGFIEKTYQKSLIEYKHQFDEYLEKTKQRFQYELKNYELFVGKRFEAITELHKQILKAYSSSKKFYGFGYTLTFEEFNELDLREHMSEKSIPKGKIDAIITLWKSDSKSAIEQMKKYLHMIEMQKIRQDISSAFSAMWTNELYLPKEIFEDAKMALVEMNKFFINLEQSYNFRTVSVDNLEELNKKSDESIEKFIKNTTEYLNSTFTRIMHE